jgi:hypothetical protein
MVTYQTLCSEQERSRFMDFNLKTGSSQGHDMALTGLFVPILLDSVDSGLRVQGLGFDPLSSCGEL